MDLSDLSRAADWPRNVRSITRKGFGSICLASEADMRQFAQETSERLTQLCLLLADTAEGESPPPPLLELVCDLAMQLQQAVDVVTANTGNTGDAAVPRTEIAHMRQSVGDARVALERGEHLMADALERIYRLESGLGEASRGKRA